MSFARQSLSDLRESFLKRLRDGIAASYLTITRGFHELKRRNDPEGTDGFMAVSRLLFIASFILGIAWLLAAVLSIRIDEPTRTLNRVGIILQMIATFSVVPEILKAQGNERLQNAIQTLSMQLAGKIKVRDLFRGKSFFPLEQDGILGFVNLICQTVFALIFIFNIGPSAGQYAGPTILVPAIWLLTFSYYVIIFLWGFFSVIYWRAKYQNHTLPDWIAGSNFFLNVFLIPGPMMAFSITALIAWLLIKLLSWLSQFEIKKVFIIVTVPLVLLGMLLQLIAV